MLGIFYDVVYIVTVGLGCCCDGVNHGLVFLCISTHFQNAVTKISEDGINTLNVAILLFDVFIKADELGGKSCICFFQTCQCAHGLFNCLHTVL